MDPPALITVMTVPIPPWVSATAIGLIPIIAIDPIILTGIGRLTTMAGAVITIGEVTAGIIGIAVVRIGAIQAAQEAGGLIMAGAPVTDTAEHAAAVTIGEEVLAGSMAVFMAVMAAVSIDARG